jgi:hypothetical protein
MLWNGENQIDEILLGGKVGWHSEFYGSWVLYTSSRLLFAFCGLPFSSQTQQPAVSSIFYYSFLFSALEPRSLLCGLLRLINVALLNAIVTQQHVDVAVSSLHPFTPTFLSRWMTFTFALELHILRALWNGTEHRLVPVCAQRKFLNFYEIAISRSASSSVVSW